MLRQRLLVVLAMLVLCSLSAMLLESATASAQTELKAKIESYVVKNVDGSDVTEHYVMAGDSYVVSLEIKIGANLTNNTLILYTALEKTGDVYWHLDDNYPGVDTESWQPGKSEIEFRIIEGTAKFTLEGKVPEDYTVERKQTRGGELTLHKPRNIPLVQLYLGPERQLLAEQQRVAEVIDQAIERYLGTLTKKKSALEIATTGPDKADKVYTQLAQAVIGNAIDLYDKGHVEEATALLNTLPEEASNYPTPVPEGSYTVYYAIIAVLAIILIALVGLFLRARASSSFIRQQVDEETGRLDVLSVRISKIDKQLGGDVEQVKEQLERIIGR